MPVLLLTMAAMLPAAALAEPFQIGLPLACTPGKDCWVIRYVDHDAGPGFKDHACGALGTNGHDGTDFGLRDSAAIANPGTDVTAVAAGTVRAVRDGEPDQPPGGRIANDYKDRNCGNGALIEHGDGWQTQYCHMTPGSLVVRPGQAVEAGQKLGRVGMSGEANFAHVHLTVRHQGKPVDPFDGLPMQAACTEHGTPLWRPDLLPELAYDAVPVTEVGLAGHVPRHEDIVAGTVKADLRADAPLVAYVMAYGLLPGDRITLAIDGPDGRRVSEAAFPLDEAAPRATRSGGRRAPPGGWAAGRYKVVATIARGGKSFSGEGSATLPAL